MNLDLIRKQSFKTASSLGFTVNKTLPLLDDVQTMRTTDEAIERLLCMHATAACAYGFDREKAKVWLERESIFGKLTTVERQFIDVGAGVPDQFKIQIEGMWALAWSLGVVPCLDFGKNCDNRFVMVLPNLKVGEKSDALRSKVTSHAIDEIVAACDLAYCLHWAIRQARLDGSKPPGKVEPYVIKERRRALEWLLCSEPWDKVSLDT
jgi:hypothetical protein